MNRLSVAGLHKQHGRQPVLLGVDLDLPAGSIAALLGASGCGKTTLLRLVAGFDRADRGTITIADRRVVDANGSGAGLFVPPEQRRIGYVPQEGGLFPHLTVAQNVAFGLSRADRHGDRVAEMLRLTGMHGLDRRYPNQLSGGQQQRTALARALAPSPALVLLDEPFNALDMELRRSVCRDVIAVIRSTGATALLVTHDPQEAFASADLVAVMRSGTIAQCDAPERVYRTPADAEIGRLTGPGLLLDGAVSGLDATTPLGRIRLHPDPTLRDGPARILVRPEQIVVAADGEGAEAAIQTRSFRGDHTLVTLMLPAPDPLTLELRLTDPSLLADPTRARIKVSSPCVAFPR